MCAIFQVLLSRYILQNRYAGLAKGSKTLYRCQLLRQCVALSGTRIVSSRQGIRRGLVFRKAINRPSYIAQASFLVAWVVFLGILRRLVRCIVFLRDKSRDDRIGGIT